MNHKNEPEEPTAFLFQLVNAGFAPSDYSNRGAPISERTQLTVGPENPRGGRPRSEMVLVLHNPGFNGIEWMTVIYQRLVIRLLHARL